jgi:carbamoyl-phosphate synthase small subunit
MRATAPRPGFLLLEDGTLFRGQLAAASDHLPAVAEVVFTTNMSGYQEVFTDPSYQGQIVVMTAPMIGNYGVNAEDPESPGAQVAGVIVRELSKSYSNWRAKGDLESWLKAAGIPVLEEVDTRRLTRHLRTVGSLRGVIGAGLTPDKAAVATLESCPSMEGLDLATVVSTKERYDYGSPKAKSHIVAYDFGIKEIILRLFAEQDCRVTVVPSETPAEDVLALEPDGVFLSNGPGNPAAVEGAHDNVQVLLGKVPMFGICLGHQIMGLALGAETFKLRFGHHGANHPVTNLDRNQVEITSQNHNYAIDRASLPDGVEVTHVNLNDADVEGVRAPHLQAFSVQYHPEAGPGPHDARYLFQEFVELMKNGN